METLALLDHLKATYPYNEWFLEPYSHEGEEFLCIKLRCNGLALYDPRYSEDGKEYQPNRHGVLWNDCELIRVHNRHFILTQVVTGFDLDIVIAEIYKHGEIDLDADPRHFLTSFMYFDVSDEGGNCLAYRLNDRATGNHLLVVDIEGEGLPKTFRDVLICKFNAAEELISEGDYLSLIGKNSKDDLWKSVTEFSQK